MLQKDDKDHGRFESTGPSDKDHDLGKEITIIVNGREKTVGIREELTFDKLVSLAFDNPPTGEFIEFTITYRHGAGNKPQGTLTKNDVVRVKEGMIFNVTPTDKS